MPGAFTVTGVRQVVAKLLGMAARANDLRDPLRRVAQDTQDRITGIPVRTGRLARSVEGGSAELLNVDRDGFELGTEVPYARYVFHGTRYMEARPPRVPPDVARRAAVVINADLKRP